MGDPRTFRKLYQTPRHPWQGDRITEERALLAAYGLKNKREIYRVTTRVKNFTMIAKRLIASSGSQADLERQQLLDTLHSFGLLQNSTSLDDVLGLKQKDLLERRLQTVLFRKGIARSMKQARQFISHNHVAIGSRVISSPGYLVRIAEEADIQVVQSSSLSSVDHPERVPIVKKAPKRRKVERTEKRRRMR